jgi:uncharacterized protein (DUF305 family)
MHFTDADVDFVTGMISHHAQALIMSELAPTHGASQSVQTLAARIINAQRDEIALMQRWLADRGQPVPQVKIDGLNLMIDMKAPAADHAMHDMAEHHMPGMLTRAQLEELAAAFGPEFDRLFLTYMIGHHAGAVTMVDDLFAVDGTGQDAAVFKLASDVQVDGRAGGSDHRDQPHAVDAGRHGRLSAVGRRPLITSKADLLSDPRKGSFMSSETPFSSRAGSRRIAAHLKSAWLVLGTAGLLGMTACASSGGTSAAADPALNTPSSATEPLKEAPTDENTVQMPDPRVGLGAGLLDAEEAIWNMGLLSASATPTSPSRTTTSFRATTTASRYGTSRIPRNLSW